MYVVKLESGIFTLSGDYMMQIVFINVCSAANISLSKKKKEKMKWLH